jgi:bifunctional UDP-N-acetylglucosamine pyrophosphorylase/glucosamine-1-phosphate N-acetyltransferase
MHPVAGRPMVRHVLAAVGELHPERTVVVIGPGMEGLAAAVAPAETAVQQEPLGTAHAVLAAHEALEGFGEGEGDADIVILFGDAAMIEADTIRDLIAARRKAGAALAVLGVHVESANRYGRLRLDQAGDLAEIVEYRDAPEDLRASTLCNSGMMAVDARLLFELVGRIGNDNAKNEYYLTEIVALARADGHRCTVLETHDPEDLIGADDRRDLARFEAAMQRRLRDRAMVNGVHLMAPDTVFLSYDTELDRDVVIEPHVVLGPGVKVGEGVRIKSFCHLEGAAIAPGAQIGPYARLRPGADIASAARIGNFVEVKNARIEEGAKVNHLSYVGDAWVGSEANLGAGTITCNYDGIAKHLTEIGAGAFIGSNTALVAPVKVGDGAIIGAGSTITRDVEADALAVARGRQENRQGFATHYRKMKAARKARHDKEN